MSHVIENLKTSSHDTLDYKIVILQNGLTALLIKDENALKSAAALVAHIGSLKDPEEYQGLAHFLEHMLFMGSEKYPDQAEYGKFIGANGGWYNAYTSLSITNYHFECSKETFYKALDMFAQFYISPLFKDDCVSKEKNAVDSEAQLHLNSDGWKKFQLKKSLSKSGSIYRQFSIGNLETLNKEGIVDALKDFHKKYYSSNTMSLVISTPDDLNTMSNHVEEIFSGIQNKKLEHQSFKDEIFPYSSEENCKLIKVVPVKELDELYLTFTIPPQYEHSKHKVLNYFGHLYGHESEGSILNLLMEEGLATELSAGGSDTEDYITELEITISLTKKGLSEYKKVISIIGAYTNMLIQQGPQEWVWKEIKDVAELGFEYPDKVAGASMCVSYASRLATAVAQKADLQKFIYNLKAVGDWKPEVITNILNFLKIENAQIYLISKEFEGKTDQTEYYFKTNYGIENIPEDIQEAYRKGDISWKTCDSSIHLPEKNTLIPTDFSLLEGEEKQVEKVVSNEESEIYFQQDVKFKLPKAAVSCMIYNGHPIEDNQDINYIAAREIYVKCLYNFMRSTNYLASMAKCDFKLTSNYRGLSILGKCYNQSVGPYFKMLSQQLIKFQEFSDERKFNDVKEQLIKSYKNKMTNSPFRVAFGCITQILVNGKFSYEDYIAAFEKITWADFQVFQTKYLKQVRFEWLFEGNLKVEEVKIIAQTFQDSIKQIFSPETLPRDQITKLETIKLDNKTYFIEKDILVKSENNSNYLQVFQISQGNEQFAHANWLGAWLKDHYFEELRTNQQLGYAVFAITQNWNSVRHFAFCIQSDKESTEHCRKQTWKFLEEFKSKIAELSEEEFNKIKAGCIARVTEKHKNLFQKFNDDLNEILTREYNWERKTTQEEAFKALTKQQVVELYDEVFFKNARTLEFHQYAPSRKEEGVNFRKERIQSEGIVFAESNDDLKSKTGKFEDIWANIPA